MTQFSASISFKFSSNFDKISKKVSKGVKSMTKDFGKLTKSVAANEQGFQSLATFLKRGFLVGLAALTAAFAIATVKAQEYEKALAQLSAITGLAGQNLEAFGKQSLQASNRFGIAASEYLEGVQLVASAKPELLGTPQLLKEITDEAGILAKASGIDLRNAANSLTDSMNQFELGAEDANRAINVLAAGSKFGASLVGDTAQALVKSGVAAKLAGQTFEETNAAIQILAQRGIRGALAGTQLRGTFLTLNQVMAQNNIPDVATALEMLAVAQERGADLTKLFGRENITAATILIESRKKVQDMTKAITGTQIASEQAKVNMQAFGERMARLKQTVLNALMVGFEPFIDALGNLAEKAAGVLAFLGKYPRVITGIIVALTILTGVLGALALGVTIVLMEAMITAFVAAAEAVLAFTAALLVNPITWIVVGIVALIAGLAILIAKWDNLRNLIVQVGMIFVSFWKGVLEGLIEFVIPAFEDLWKSIKEVGEPLMEIFDIADDLFGSMGDSLEENNDLFETMKNIGRVVGRVLGLAIRMIITPLRVVIVLFKGWLDIVSAIGNAVVGNFNKSLEALKRFVKRGKELILPFIENIKAAGRLIGLFKEDPVEGPSNTTPKRMDVSEIIGNTLKNGGVQVDINVNSEGRVKVEKVESKGNVETNVNSGLMVPEGM